MITTAEAAQRLGVSRRRVLYLIAAGRLVAERVGRDWGIDPAALALLARQDGPGYPRGRPRKPRP